MARDWYAAADASESDTALHKILSSAKWITSSAEVDAVFAELREARKDPA